MKYAHFHTEMRFNSSMAWNQRSCEADLC